MHMRSALRLACDIYSGIMRSVVWCPVVLFCSVQSQAQMFFESIGNAELIPDNVVTDIAQDKQGFLWIATAAGVVRYDGYRYKLYSHNAYDNTSIGGNFVRNINVFDDGTVWLSTEPGGVSIYNPESEGFTRLFSEQFLLENPDLSSVAQILRDQQDQIWLATNTGLFLATLQGELLAHYTVEHGIPHNGIRALLRDKNGEIWVGTRAGLARYSRANNVFERVTANNADVKNLYIRTLFEDDMGQIWIGSNASGLWRFDPDSGLLLQALAEQPEEYQKSTIYDIFQKDDKEIWAARFGGIDRIAIKDGRWLSRSIHDPSDSFSLANNDIRTMLKDRSGLVWIGGYGGGVQRVLGDQDWVKTLRFSLLTENALTEPNVSSVLALSSGDIWVGTRGGGINVVKSGQGVVGSHKPEINVAGKLQSGWITAMAEMSNGEIWVGVNPGQLYRYNPFSDEFFLYTQKQGLPRVNIRAIRPSVNGGVWVGTNSGLIYWQPDTDQFIRYPMQDGNVMRDGINALHEQENGQLLVATGATGLYVVKPGTEYLVAVDGQDANGRLLNTISIVGLLYDSQKRLWLDTPAGLHLAIFDDVGIARLENHSEKAGFGGRPMGANLLEDKLGRIWSPTHVYEPELARMTPLQRADGVDIGTNWFRSYTRTSHGEFLFGGSRGLMMVKPERYSLWGYQPAVVASELWIDGELVNSGRLAQDGLTLEPGQRRFSIEFAALDLSAPDKNRYRYQLVGYDRNWTQVDATRRIASYSNLWPGEYIFQVEGTNRTGQKSNQNLTFSVYIKAQYWQTGWFIGLCIFLAISLFYGGFRIRTQWIKARARALESLVEERTQELKKAQADFIEQEKMASLGGLVAGVSHEINTPMGIALTAATALYDDCRWLENKVSENRLKRSDLEKHLNKLRESNKIILSSLERACALTASFKQVAVDQTSEQRREFELKTLLQDIQRSLNSLYSKKGHKLIIECPDGIKLDSYPGALFQIFTNLVNNSVLHGFANNKRGSITISAKKQANMLFIEYRDDGVGMTAEVKKKAFEPFFTTRLGVGGSGLGMHLVYNYVSQVLGGKISIKSAPGEGFTCYIELPFFAPTKKGQ